MNNLLRSVVRKLVHDHVFVQIMADSHWLVEVGVCEEEGPEKEPHSKNHSQCDDNEHLVLVVLRQFDVGIDIVVVVVWDYSYGYDWDQKKYVLWRFVVQLETRPTYNTLLLHFVDGLGSLQLFGWVFPLFAALPLLFIINGCSYLHLESLNLGRKLDIEDIWWIDNRLSLLQAN